METVKSKYRFLKNYIQSICFKYKSINDVDGLSPCLEYKNYIYKIGDVIEFSYYGGGLGMLPIKEKNIGLPMSYFEKVSDTTPLSKENISFGSKSLTGNSTLANTSSKPLSKVEPKLSKKYKFTKDYFLDGGGAIFKKNDIIVGEFMGNTIQYQNHSIPLEFVVEIPLENKSKFGGSNEINDFPTFVVCNDGKTDVGNGAVAPCMGNGGVKKENSTTDVTPETFLQKNKTNLLIVGVLVLGYLAYKKYKK
jgi:hypothetical protein